MGRLSTRAVSPWMGRDVAHANDGTPFDAERFWPESVARASRLKHAPLARLALRKKQTITRYAVLRSVLSTMSTRARVDSCHAHDPVKDQIIWIVGQRAIHNRMILFREVLAQQRQRQTAGQVGQQARQ